MSARTETRLTAVRRTLGKRFEKLMEAAGYAWHHDGLATKHYSPFVDDRRFSDAYARLGAEGCWPVDAGEDIRWRIWLLAGFARAASVGGAFAEFGVYRGGCASMLLQTPGVAPPRFFLFDTFTGIPDTGLTKIEQEAAFDGRLATTSADEVRSRLSEWHDVIEVVQGDVFETLGRLDSGPLSFVHIDLNATAPTRLALEYTLERLLPGGIVVFDDYGWSGYEEQRDAIDSVLDGRGESLVALPTGQAVLTRSR